MSTSTPDVVVVVVVGSDRKLLHRVSNLGELPGLSIHVAIFEIIGNIIAG